MISLLSYMERKRYIALAPWNVRAMDLYAMRSNVALTIQQQSDYGSEGVTLYAARVQSSRAP